MKTALLTLSSLLFVIVISAQTSFNNDELTVDSEVIFIDDNNYGVFVDNRDGIEYSIVKIGEELWMSENLNFASDNSWCYDEKTSNCNKFGRLYTYESALTACPDGWHLPNDSEWSGMVENLQKEREGKTLTLEEKKNGFNTDLGGWKSKSGNYYNYKEIGYYWSSEKKGIDYAWYFYINSLSDDFHKNYHNVNMAFSVRCIKD